LRDRRDRRRQDKDRCDRARPCRPPRERASRLPDKLFAGWLRRKEIEFQRAIGAWESRQFPPRRSLWPKARALPKTINVPAKESVRAPSKFLKESAGCPNPNSAGSFERFGKNVSCCYDTPRPHRSLDSSSYSLLFYDNYYHSQASATSGFLRSCPRHFSFSAHLVIIVSNYCP